MDLAVLTLQAVCEHFASENLPTEARWERLVIEALLACPEVESVRSILPIWRSPHPMPQKFIDGCRPEELKDLVVVAPNGWPIFGYGSPIDISAHGVVLNNYYSSLFRLPEFRRLEAACGGRVFSVDPFARYSEQTGLRTPYGEPSVHLPRIPRIEVGSPRDNTILLWPHKGLHDAMRYRLFDVGALFQWLAKRLKADPNLSFHALTALGPAEVASKGYTADFFWSHPTTAELRDVSDQVVVHLEMGWDEVLALYAKTRLMISSPNSGYLTAGPAPEAGMYGVPYVIVSEPWWGAPAYFSSMDRLLDDPEYYEEFSGLSAERARPYTYANFTTNLFAAMKRRGLT